MQVFIKLYLGKPFLLMHLLQGSHQLPGMKTIIWEGNQTWSTMVNKVHKDMVIRSTTIKDIKI